MTGVWITLLVIVVILVVFGLRIVPQGHAYIIERLGKYAGTWEAGLHIMIPFIDRVAKRISLKEQVRILAPIRGFHPENVIYRFSRPRNWARPLDLYVTGAQDFRSVRLMGIQSA